ncbi:MAG TPA: HEAT repeat domain-containing protein [Candidatus Xenobia bacterium]
MELWEGLGARDWRDRMHAVESLSLRPSAAMVDRLVDMARQSHRDLGKLNAALQLLSRSALGTRGLQTLMADSQPEVRSYAALALGRTGSTDAVEALRRALRDEGPNVRSNAIESLGILGAREAVPDLLDLAGSDDFFTVFPAIEALGRIGDERAVPLLIQHLHDELLAEAAAVALGLIGDRRALEPLAGWIGGSGDPVLGLCILAGFGDEARALALASVTEDQVQQALEAWSQSPDKWPAGLTRAAGWIVTGPWARLREVSMRLLIRLLQDRPTRAAAAEVLCHVGRDGLSMLVEQLDHPDEGIRQAVISVLGRMADPRAADALLEAAGDEVPYGAALALRAWDQTSAGADTEALLPALGHPSSLVRQTAIALVLRHQELIGPLRDRLASGNPFERESGLRLLASTAGASAVWIKALSDPAGSVRRTAVELLAHVVDIDEGAASAVSDALTGGDPTVRAAAARALAQAHPLRARPLLVQALHDRDPWTRMQACRSLGRVGTRDDVPIVAALAADPLPFVQAAVAEALGWLGGGAAVAHLDKLSQSSDRDVVLSALAGLGMSGHPDALRPLMAALGAADATVRRAAATGLREHGSPAGLEALGITLDT